MKFICSVENGTTFVALDLKDIPAWPGEFDYMRTICMFRGTYHAFDFTIINEFLSRLDKITLKHIVSTLSNMRRCIANSGHDDPAADKCVGEISQYMKELVEYTPMYLTGNILKELYRYSKKFITKNSRVSESCSVIDRKMFITASLLSALCVMVIHDFETHFTDVDEPLQVLYPVFEEAIKNSGIDGAKKFVEKYRTLMEDMNGDVASWVIEVIYINGCMIRDHGPGLPIDVAVIENYTQRILSSKSYFANKRIKEMKEINKAEEQQRMENNKVSVTSLTDDELKEFNEKIEHGKLLPMREILKDTLDIIHFTVKYFLKYSVPKIENAEKDSTRELLIDSWQKIIFNAKSQVDEMADDELAKIAKHANCVQDAFNLVKMHIPVGMYQSQLIEDREFPGLSTILGELKLKGYLRKIVDIYDILNTPIERYMGSTIEYFSGRRRKELLSELSADKGAAHRISDDLGYVIYNTGLRHPYFVYLNEQPLDKVIGEPDIFLKWVDENVNGIDKDEFFEFLTRHESEISAYARLKSSYPQLNTEEKDEICTFFVRWFLKEQTTK